MNKEQLKNAIEAAKATILTGNEAWMSKHEQDIAEATLNNFIIELMSQVDEYDD